MTAFLRNKRTDRKKLANSFLLSVFYRIHGGVLHIGPISSMGTKAYGITLRIVTGFR